MAPPEEAPSPPGLTTRFRHSIQVGFIQLISDAVVKGESTSRLVFLDPLLHLSDNLRLGN